MHFSPKQRIFSKRIWLPGFLLTFCVLQIACSPRLDLARVDQTKRKSRDPAIDQEWQAAKKAFEANPSTSDVAFEAFISAHPQDKLLPVAYLFLSRAKLADQSYAEAKEAAENAQKRADKNSDVERAARYLQAMALVGLGQFAEALPILLEFRDKFSDPAENARVALAIGEAASSVKKPRLAIASFSEAYALSEKKPDRLYATYRAQSLVGALSTEELRALYKSADKESLAAVVIAPRLALELSASGDTVKATDVLSETRRARIVIFGSDIVEGFSNSGADTQAIGAVLPLTGKTARIGRLFLRGLFFAAEGAARPGEDAPFRLVLRDSGSTPEGAKAAVEELVKIEGVIGIIGPSDPSEAKEAANAASRLGTPMVSLSLDPSVTEEGNSIFWAFVDNDLQARSLARHAIQSTKLTRVAVLYPDTPYGRSMAISFIDESNSLGANVVAKANYRAGASNWDKQIRSLVRAKPQAIFIADGPKALSGLAPALAAGGLWSQPPGKKPPRGKAVQLLAPSPAISQKLLSDASSTLEGAVFAAEFFAEDPGVESFRKDFSLREKELPTFFDAAAYDAFRYLASAVTDGASSRSALQQALLEKTFSSLSGEVSFGSDRRADRTLTLLRVKDSQFQVLQ